MSVLPHRFVHRQHVLNGTLGLDVMDGIEDKASPWSKDFDSFQNFFPNIFRGSIGQGMLRINPGSPESDG